MAGKTFDFAQVLEQVEERNPSLVVDGVKFRNVYLLTFADRKLISEMFKNIGGEDVDAEAVENIYVDVLTLVAEDKDAAGVLLEKCKAVPGAVLTLFSMYGEETKVGEA